jgi:hypothetical protein
MAKWAMAVRSRVRTSLRFNNFEDIRRGIKIDSQRLSILIVEIFWIKWARNFVVSSLIMSYHLGGFRPPKLVRKPTAFVSG